MFVSVAVYCCKYNIWQKVFGKGESVFYKFGDIRVYSPVKFGKTGTFNTEHNLVFVHTSLESSQINFFCGEIGLMLENDCYSKVNGRI